MQIAESVHASARMMRAETIIRNTRTQDQTILTLDSLQSVTSERAKNGETYLSIMTANLDILKEALS